MSDQALGGRLIMVEEGASSFLPDINGTPANLYRGQNGMAIFRSVELHKILEDLFDDSAPSVESSINIMNYVFGTN